MSERYMFRVGSPLFRKEPRLEPQERSVGDLAREVFRSPGYGAPTELRTCLASGPEYLPQALDFFNELVASSPYSEGARVQNLGLSTPDAVESAPDTRPACAAVLFWLDLVFPEPSILRHRITDFRERHSLPRREVVFLLACVDPYDLSDHAGHDEEADLRHPRSWPALRSVGPHTRSSTDLFLHFGEAVWYLLRRGGPSCGEVVDLAGRPEATD